METLNLDTLSCKTSSRETLSLDTLSCKASSREMLSRASRAGEPSRCEQLVHARDVIELQEQRTTSSPGGWQSAGHHGLQLSQRNGTSMAVGSLHE